MFVPGQGPISTARAGSAVASTQDGEAIGINPAGMATTTGTVVQIGIVALDYAMSFSRAGAYDSVAGESVPYANQPYPTIADNSKPPFGIGPYLPLPTIAVVSDLGGTVPGLRAGFGLYAPQAYPFRNLNTVDGQPYFTVDKAGRYGFPVSDRPPPPTRYDIIYAEAAAILPSLAVSYRVLPTLDIGVRLSAGTARLKASAAAWGEANYAEWIARDAVVTADAKDNFAFTYGLGAMFRPTSAIDLGVNFNAPINLHAHGDVSLVSGPQQRFAGMDIVVTAVDDAEATCAKGGTDNNLKGCIDLQLPMSLQIGGRYKFRDRIGRLRGDVEFNIDWQRWGAPCDYAKDPHCVRPSDYRLFIDAQANVPQYPDVKIRFREVMLPHGLRNTYAARLGGSYVAPFADNAIVIRGGVSY